MGEHYISNKIYSKKQLMEIDKKVKLLGVSTRMDCYLFLNLRFFGAVILFLLFFFINKLGYIVGPFVAFLYYKVCTYILLDSRIKKRQTALEMEALNFFEILTLSLETGRNLQEALNVTLTSSSASFVEGVASEEGGELAQEFLEVMREVRYGKSLTEALNDMQENIPSDTINNMILSLTQANLYGSGIIESLYNQIDYLREKKRLEVKAEISKVPIKISIISVFFFVPLVLLIILAPVLIGYLG